MKGVSAWGVVAVGATLALLAGCELLAGIGDRSLGKSIGTGGSPAQTGAGGGGGSVTTDGGLDRPLDVGGAGGAGGVSAGTGGRIDAGNDAPDAMTGAGGGAGRGGMTGTGGRLGTGGVTGTGGTTGAGGGMGTGGVSGTGGGSGTGGVTGTGGATVPPVCGPGAQNNMGCLSGFDVDCNRLCGLDLTAIGVVRAAVSCGCLSVGEWSCSGCTYPTASALACFRLPSSLVACPPDGTGLLRTGTSTCPAPDAGSCGAICGSTSASSYQDATGAKTGACACVAGVWQCAPLAEWPPASGP